MRIFEHSGGRAVLLALVVGVLAAAPAGAQTPYKKSGGLCAITEHLEVWRDESRRRDIPVKLYLPKDGPPAPVILFSPGLGGNREDYACLGSHWASQGYAVVHLQHAGTDRAVFEKAEGRLLTAAVRAAVNRDNWVNRPLDVQFAITQIEKGAVDHPLLKGRVDPRRVGVGGHSFGAYTALALIGMLVDFPNQPERSFQDPRVKAAIEMSCTGRMGGAIRESSYRRITAPCLHMTGTLDDSPLFMISAADRRVPFDRIPAADQYLVILTDADHFAFSDNPIGLDGEAVRRQPAHYGYILMATTAFWDAYLKEDAAARKWLAGNDLPALAQGACAFERKLDKADSAPAQAGRAGAAATLTPSSVAP